MDKNYLLGLIDSSGSFYITYTKNPYSSLGLAPTVKFRFLSRQKQLVDLLNEELGNAGKVYKVGERYRLEINGITNAVNKVIPFFEGLNFISDIRRLEFEFYKEITSNLLRHDHNDDAIKDIFKRRKELLGLDEPEYIDLRSGTLANRVRKNESNTAEDTGDTL